MRRILLSVFGIALLFFFTLQSPVQVFAACAAEEVQTDLGCLPSDPIGFVEKFYTWGLGLLGSVAVLFMIIGGYYLMTSQGSPSKLQTGKSFIFYAISGLLLAIFGFIFIEIVAGQILKIPGFE